MGKRGKLLFLSSFFMLIAFKHYPNQHGLLATPATADPDNLTNPVNGVGEGDGWGPSIYARPYLKINRARPPISPPPPRRLELVGQRGPQQQKTFRVFRSLGWFSIILEVGRGPGRFLHAQGKFLEPGDQDGKN